MNKSAYYNVLSILVIGKTATTVTYKLAHSAAHGTFQWGATTGLDRMVLDHLEVGKQVLITTGGVTVPQSIFSVGNIVSIVNNSGTAQTITQGTGVTMHQAGTTNTGNRTLAAWGIASVLCVGSSVFVISGNVS